MTIKQKILMQLENPGILDLKFLFSDEVLEVAMEVLQELLDEERKEFDENLKINYSEITFELFEEFSKLDLFFSLLNHLQNVKSGEKIRDIIEQFEPRYVDYGNYISYNKRYYEMLVYCRGNCSLDEEQIRILDLSIKSYEVKGINLEEEKQDRLKKINTELSDIALKFGKNVLFSEKDFFYIFENDESIRGISENELIEAKNKAEKKGKKGYLFDSSLTFYISIMSYCTDGEVRKYFYKERHKFASNGKYDNRENVIKLLKLREEKAKILGYNNYAELSLVFKMADTPENVMKLLDDVTNKTKVKAIEEIEELKTYFKLSDFYIWDLTYYSKIYKEKEFNFDERELKKYFEFDKVLSGLFEITNRLFGLQMKEVKIDSYNPDIKIYEVYKDDKLISYFIGDYFYNEDKRSGAWCDNLRPKTEYKVTKTTKTPPSSLAFAFPPQLRGIKGELFILLPIIINVCAFQKGEAGKTMLNQIDVETMFHEFGHALHEMLSKSKYSDLSGFNVEWDFVELPSQLMENWCNDKEALSIFAKHIDTNADIPDSMHESMEKLKKYGTGNFTLRQNEFASLDMNLHTNSIPNSIEELDDYILNYVNNYSVLTKDTDYKKYASFTHIFDGGYGAGYYSYMRAEIIEAQVWEIFKEKGIFDKETSARFLEYILSAGTKKDAQKLFYDFAQKEISPDAFLKRKGF